MPRLIPVILFIGLLGVSFGAPLARYLPEMPAIVIAFWRMVIAAAFLWTLSGIRREGNLLKMPPGAIFFAGIFLAIHFATFYSALKYNSVANVTLLISLAPIFMVLYERLFQRRSLPLQLLVGIGMAVSGGILLHVPGEIGTDNYLQGNLLALASGLAWAVVLILAEGIRKDMGTMPYTRWLYLIAAFCLGIVAILAGNSISFPMKDLKWLLALGIVPTLIGHNSLNWAVKYLRPSIIGSIPLGEPILAGLLAWILFQEAVGLNVYLGGGIILGGLLLVVLSPRRRGAKVSGN